MSAVVEEKKIVVGGSFLIEERTPEEIFTPEDFTEEHRMIADTRAAVHGQRSAPAHRRA